MFSEIKDSLDEGKRSKKIKEVFKCVVCQAVCSPAMYFCISGCGQLIGCFLCSSKLNDCPLCREQLPEKDTRKPLLVSGLAEHLDVADINQKSALKEAEITADCDNDDDDDDDAMLMQPAF